jgi:hypothetical protein
VCALLPLKGFKHASAARNGAICVHHDLGGGDKHALQQGEGTRAVEAAAIVGSWLRLPCPLCCHCCNCCHCCHTLTEAHAQHAAACLCYLAGCNEPAAHADVLLALSGPVENSQCQWLASASTGGSVVQLYDVTHAVSQLPTKSHLRHVYQPAVETAYDKASKTAAAMAILLKAVAED